MKKLHISVAGSKLKVTLSTEYEGWTNSKTWNASFLLRNDSGVYKFLNEYHKQGKKFDAKIVKAAFDKFRLSRQLESWTEGQINWQEIADMYNDESEEIF